MMKNFIKFVFSLLIIVQIASCENPLEEKVHSELSPNTILNTEDGQRSLLMDAYGWVQMRGFAGSRGLFFLSAYTTGEAYAPVQLGQGFGIKLGNFTMGGSENYIDDAWTSPYNAIRDINLLLANLENPETDFENLVRAEARFLRGWSYYLMYTRFGPTPLHKTPSDDPFLTRASEEEMESFIEQELLAAAESLPAEAEEYGRATEGAALGVLCKFYLNTKQWQKAADTAQDIINLNRYGLVDNYADVFSLENEGNEEMIWVLPRTAEGSSGTGGAVHFINAVIFPRDYPLLPNQAVFGSVAPTHDEFVNSFAEDDPRRDMIVTEYISSATGEQVVGLGNDRSYILKYEFDPAANGFGMGNDWPAVRYADILLSRAEALNELNGPTQESIDLINQVRDRVDQPLINLASFPTKESLRDRIMLERQWELFGEGKLRVDQIRAGTFIEKAQARGKNNAQDFHRRFPIPTFEIDANPNLEQNPGY